MRTDPFSLKQKSKLNPIRILATVRIRMDEAHARRHFNDYVIPQMVRDVTADASDTGWEDTAVTPL